MDINETMPETTEEQKHDRLMQWRVWSTVTALRDIRPMPSDEELQDAISAEVVQRRLWVGTVEKLLGLPAGKLTDHELRVALIAAFGKKS
jgi:flagellar biosynthesis regulator FlaF